MSTPPTPGRPSVDDVARILRARTKDDQQHEVGTFDDETRPTGEQVEGQIDDSMALVGLRTPPFEKLPEALLPAVRATVALHAACVVEKSYFPEQVLSDRSAYQFLQQEADAALTALSDAANAAMGGDEYSRSWASVRVGSWTLAGRADCPPPEEAAP